MMLPGMWARAEVDYAAVLVEDNDLYGLSMRSGGVGVSKRLPLEGKLAAQPTDEVSVPQKIHNYTSSASFVGTFPSRGRL